jgi:hypothetical protein
MSCYGEARWSATSCALVTDIVGQVAVGSGPAIVLMAHMDSVAAGPGAADDASNDAAILETIRAWKARSSFSKHPILALFTDGEESGMLGAHAFLDDRQWSKKIGVVVNLEARGDQGRSFLFQTSPGDGSLIDLYAQSVKHFAASSVYAEIYRRLPNDTDLTPFLRAGITGYNFAFIGNVAYYHTPRDRQDNLDLQSLQQQGDSALGLLSSLSRTDFTQLRSNDEIYFDVLGFWLPRLSKSWSFPLSVVAFLGIAIAGWLRPRRPRSLLERMRALSMPPLLLVSAVAAGFVLYTIPSLISGYPDPSFAHPWALRAALYFGVWSVALMVTRLNSSVCDAWLWISGIGAAVALTLPGLSPYFLFPSLIAAFSLLVTARLGDRGWRLAAFVGALASAFTWLNFAATAEAIMGLAAHPLFTISGGLALLALVPLMTKTGIQSSALISAGLAFIFSITAGFLSPFTYALPERLNLYNVEYDRHASWVADPVTHLPNRLARAGHFSNLIKCPFSIFNRCYLGDAGVAENIAPRADVRQNPNRLTLALHGSRQADGMMLIFPTPLALQSINGHEFKNIPPSAQWNCHTPDCSSAVVTFAGTSPRTFDLIELRRGLPPKGQALLKARPDIAVPSFSGDQTLLIRHIATIAPELSGITR